MATNCNEPNAARDTESYTALRRSSSWRSMATGRGEILSAGNDRR